MLICLNRWHQSVYLHGAMTRISREKEADHGIFNIGVKGLCTHLEWRYVK